MVVRYATVIQGMHDLFDQPVLAVNLLLDEAADGNGASRDDFRAANQRQFQHSHTVLDGFTFLFLKIHLASTS